LAEPTLSQDFDLVSDGFLHERVIRALHSKTGQDCIRFSLRSANGSPHRISPVQLVPRRDSRLASCRGCHSCDGLQLTSDPLTQGHEIAALESAVARTARHKDCI